MLLKVFQTSQENAFVGVFFDEAGGLQPAGFLKRDSNTSALLWSLENFQEHLFWRTSANNCLTGGVLWKRCSENFAIFTGRK